MSRNRNRNAGRRAEQLAQKLDDEDDWKANYRSFHLGEKLIALAVRFAQFEGTPLLELNTFRESGSPRSASAIARSLKIRTRTTISLTTTACDWIAEHQPALESLLSPVYQPMVVPPRPWTSLSGGGYLVNPLQLLKRQPNKRAQRLLKKAVLTPVLSAVTAMQNTAFRINKDIHRNMRDGWDGGHPYFGLETLSLKQLPPRLPDDADPDQIHERKRERADAYI